ncbi:uncharacterized protein LOC130508492 [Raphanus sativus]|uniref:Uncharacterized protein LOC130508492 n=1 Tax=Raphanus sativus TaxID=3726 RepID=A0A9W3D826_RAPSA|nr:uncharacterized protein LOC130508492 [Raphanus sativus]
MSTETEDVDLWRGKTGFKPCFSTNETWLQIRKLGTPCAWGKGIWFSQATPKFAFMTWIAARNRLATMDRISYWNQGVDSTCVLCKAAQETRNHLFFQCTFSSQLWEQLVKGILRNAHTQNWDDIIELISVSTMERKKTLSLRYAFQISVYTIWRERNKRRHGDSPMPLQVLLKLTDKAIRNKLSLIQKKRVKGMDTILQFWFSTRL